MSSNTPRMAEPGAVELNSPVPVTEIQSEKVDYQQHASEADIPKTRIPLRNVTLEDMDDLKDRFSYHSPKEGQPHKYEQVRTYGQFLATQIIEHAPDCTERDTAISKVEEATFWANAAIARKG